MNANQRLVIEFDVSGTAYVGWVDSWTAPPVNAVTLSAGDIQEFVANELFQVETIRAASPQVPEAQPTDGTVV